MTDKQHKAKWQKYLDQGIPHSIRLKKIAHIIECVDDRCLAVDGPVTDTRTEMTAQEMRAIYWLSLGMVPK